MATFKYEAISKGGQTVQGVVEAANRDDAVIRIRHDHRMVNSVKEISEKPRLLDYLSSPKISDKSLSIICQQFSIILTAGLPLVKTVELVSKQTEDKTLKALLTKISDDVNSGYSLADSFALHGKSLSATFVETVRAGEQSGNLPMVFDQLSKYYTKKSKTGNKVRAALTYPVFVIIVAVVVVGIVMVKAVPVFTRTFASMGNDLPGVTKALIATSNFFNKYAWLLIIICVLVFAAYKVYQKTEKGSLQIEKLKLSFPLLGSIRMMNACAHFANTFSTLLKAGVPLTRALNTTAKTIGNRYLEASLTRCSENVEQGFKLGDVMRAEGVFPELLTEMTTVGENSGRIEETLLVVSDFYENETETTTNRALAVLEPSIILVLAVFVVWILLAVYLPMFNMYGSMGA